MHFHFTVLIGVAFPEQARTSLC